MANFLVGSRFLKLNTADSDYDIQELEINSTNQHVLEIATLHGKRADIHKFHFEDKYKLLESLSPASFQALLYKGFRKFWDITDSEAITKINEFKHELRPYEYLYFKQQLLHEDITFEEIQEAYKKYKLEKGSSRSCEKIDFI